MQKTKLLISLLLITINLFGQTISNKLITTRLDDLYNTFFTKDGAGCATLIAKNGKIIYEKGFGLADIELNVAANPGNVFRIGSITKQFTSIAILQLYEQDGLHLQDEIKKYIPDFPLSRTKIKIENLLTHTSGIKNLTEIKGLEINKRLILLVV